ILRTAPRPTQPRRPTIVPQAAPHPHGKVSVMTVRRVAGLLVLGVVLLLLLPSAAGYYTDWLWFKELGYEGVFLRTLNAQAVVFLSAFLLSFLFLFVNFKLARR